MFICFWCSLISLFISFILSVPIWMVSSSIAFWWESLSDTVSFSCCSVKENTFYSCSVFVLECFSSWSLWSLVWASLCSLTSFSCSCVILLMNASCSCNVLLIKASCSYFVFSCSSSLLSSLSLTLKIWSLWLFAAYYYLNNIHSVWSFSFLCLFTVSIFYIVSVYIYCLTLWLSNSAFSLSCFIS